MNVPGMPNIQTGNKKNVNHKTAAPMPNRVKIPQAGMENSINGNKRNLKDLMFWKCSLVENIKYASPGVINAKCRIVIQVSGVDASLSVTNGIVMNKTPITYNQVINNAKMRLVEGDLKGDSIFLSIFKILTLIFKYYSNLNVWKSSLFVHNKLVKFKKLFENTIIASKK
jgi:hypothetical protein